MISFHARILGQFTRHVYCKQHFREILRFSQNERKLVMYISGGKSILTPVHKFTNHSRFSVNFTRHVLILAATRVTYKPFAFLRK